MSEITEIIPDDMPEWARDAMMVGQLWSTVFNKIEELETELADMQSRATACEHNFGVEHDEKQKAEAEVSRLTLDTELAELKLKADGLYTAVEMNLKAELAEANKHLDYAEALVLEAWRILTSKFHDTAQDERAWRMRVFNWDRAKNIFKLQTKLEELEAERKKYPHIEHLLDLLQVAYDWMVHPYRATRLYPADKAEEIQAILKKRHGQARNALAGKTDEKESGCNHPIEGKYVELREALEKIEKIEPADCNLIDNWYDFARKLQRMARNALPRNRSHHISAAGTHTEKETGLCKQLRETKAERDRLQEVATVYQQQYFQECDRVKTLREALEKIKDVVKTVPEVSTEEQLTIEHDHALSEMAGILRDALAGKEKENETATVNSTGNSNNSKRTGDRS